jgi:hypothetical protein
MNVLLLLLVSLIPLERPSVPSDPYLEPRLLLINSAGEPLFYMDSYTLGLIPLEEKP